MKLGSLSFSNKYQLLVLVFVAFGLNINTLFHGYVLDDIVVLTENKFVEKGIKGIPELLSTDYVSGYSGKINVLGGARYRPLSLILFALEHQFFGANPMVSHLFNILFFAILIALLYKLLQSCVFREQDDNLAFITCLLFVVHPIHTEVIANVKSRDEIITFILLTISLITFLKNIEKRKIWLLLTSLSCFLLALLTKESAVTFIGVVPLFLYFFLHQSVKNSILLSIPFIILFAGYMLLRYLIVGFEHYPVHDITNSPYLYATSSEAFATKTFILFKYLCLLVFPYPLSSDYGYNQIPYISISSAQFIFSFILIIGLIAYSLYTFKMRTLFSFCILFFFVTISVGTNFIFDMGAPLAERLLFQPSLAFCIVFAFLFLKGIKNSKAISTILLFVVLILFSVKTIARNNEWKNNETLFLTDVISSPDCSRLNLYASEVYIIKANKENNIELKNEYLNKAVYYGEQSLRIHSKFAYSYLRLGFAYYHLHEYFKTADLWIQALKLEPEDPDAIKWTKFLSSVLYKEGNGFFDQGKDDEAIKYFIKSVELNKENVEALYNLGGIYFIKGDTIRAEQSWDKVRKSDPNHQFNKEEFLNYYNPKNK